MIIRVNDAGTEIQVSPDSHKDTMDIASILHRMGWGTYELKFDFPHGDDDKPMMRFSKLGRTKVEASPRVRQLMEACDRDMRRERDDLYVAVGELEEDNHGLRDEVQRLRDKIDSLGA